MMALTKIHPMEVRQAALQRYFQGVTLQAIAAELDVPYTAVHRWHAKEGWAKLRRQYRTDLMNDWRQKLLVEAQLNTLMTFNRHLEFSNQFIDKLKEFFQGDKQLTTKELLELTKAYASGHRVFSRLCKVIFPPIDHDGTAAKKRPKRGRPPLVKVCPKTDPDEAALKSYLEDEARLKAEAEEAAGTPVAVAG